MFTLKSFLTENFTILSSVVEIVLFFMTCCIIIVVLFNIVSIVSFSNSFNDNYLIDRRGVILINIILKIENYISCIK